jgi:uncharacterized protein involved in exopolysaccharide biosynthesis
MTAPHTRVNSTPQERQEGLEAHGNSSASISVLDILLPWFAHWRSIVVGTLMAALLTFTATFAIDPVFSARTVFLPPQTQGSTAAAAMASLGSLATLAGSAGVLRTPADQYAALMQSATIENRIIKKFNLQETYRQKNLSDTRLELERATRINIGKKDGLISVEVDDTNPSRAAEIANTYVDELRNVLATLTLTEAQQRRKFFELELANVRTLLAKSQTALQSSAFNASTLRSEPRMAAENYARLKAEVTSAEVRLQSMRSSLVDTSTEVQAQLGRVSALRAQLLKLEAASHTESDPNYLGKYREFKYYETLFEMFARQYEIARLDESKEGPLLQVIDTATPPEVKSRPRRVVLTAVGTFFALVVLLTWISVRASWQTSKRDPVVARKIASLKSALKRRRIV